MRTAAPTALRRTPTGRSRNAWRSTAACCRTGPVCSPWPATGTGWSVSLNHLAFHATDRTQVDALAAAAAEHGWIQLYPDRHPYAGGPDHYAAYLEDTDGYEVEIVAPAPDPGL